MNRDMKYEYINTHTCDNVHETDILLMFVSVVAIFRSL